MNYLIIFLIIHLNSISAWISLYICKNMKITMNFKTLYNIFPVFYSHICQIAPILHYDIAYFLNERLFNLHPSMPNIIEFDKVLD